MHLKITKIEQYKSVKAIIELLGKLNNSETTRVALWELLTALAPDWEQYEICSTSVANCLCGICFSGKPITHIDDVP